MNQNLWTKVDEYYSKLFLPKDEVLEKVLENSKKAELPPHQVSPNQGMFLHILVLMQKAEKILEIGTLGGYSTICMARALPPSGKLTTIELHPEIAEIAKKNFVVANLSEKIDQKVGKALNVLPQIEKENKVPFDMIFIDADKKHNPKYFEWALKLSRKGSIIIIDNVVRAGEVINEKSIYPSIKGTQKLNELIKEKQVKATTIQTVGIKGHDGFTIVFV